MKCPKCNELQKSVESLTKSLGEWVKISDNNSDIAVKYKKQVEELKERDLRYQDNCDEVDRLKNNFDDIHGAVHDSIDYIISDIYPSFPDAEGDKISHLLGLLQGKKYFEDVV